MNAVTLVNELLSRFGLKEISSFGGATGSDQIVALRKVNLAIQMICGRHPFQWLHKTSTGSITAVAGTATYSLNSDVKQLLAAKHTYGNGVWLKVMDRQTIEIVKPDRSDSGDRSTPTHIILFGKTASGSSWLWQVELHPVPDTNFDAQVISYYYTIVPTDLSATTDVPIIPDDFHWLIVDQAELLWRRGPLRVGGEQSQVDLYLAAQESVLEGMRQIISQDNVVGHGEAIWGTNEPSLGIPNV